MQKLIVICLIILSCGNISNSQDSLYAEKYRPQFHFSPARNWTNDPNGLLYYKGVYHLFYQHNPFGNRWGHMSWGHAESKDLIHWKHRPVAIPEKNGIMIFSGSAVADIRNTSGFAKNNEVPLVAIYTGHTNANQSQCLAFSLDEGASWTQYEGNPVLDLHKKDFRDPKIFWYEPQQKWVMLAVLPQDHIVQFYESKNLKTWHHMSDFGPAGDTSGIWECPDLVEVPVRNNAGLRKWVLINSQQTTVQYFVGSFDGNRFINENPPGKIYRQDYGPDYYAVISYNNLPDTHAPVSIGWANNWRYANDIPTTPWKSAMSLPRELTVTRNGNEWLLLQQPVKKLQTLRRKEYHIRKLSVKGTRLLPVQTTVVEMILDFAKPASGVAGVRLAVGNGKHMEIGIDGAADELYIDRSAYNDGFNNASFQKMSRYAVPLRADKNSVRLHIFFDKSILEVYAEGGAKVLTMQVFPDEENKGIELFSNINSDFTGTVWPLSSIWK